MISIVQAHISYTLTKTKKSTVTGSFLNVCVSVALIQRQRPLCEQGHIV